MTLFRPFVQQGRARPAKGRTRHEPGRMNHTEQAYAAWLGQRYDTLWWAFESWTFVLPGGVRYTPDFAVQLGDATIELVDVKAFYKSTQQPGIKDDALVKVKIAAATYPLFVWKFSWMDPRNGWVERVFEEKGA